MKEKKNVYVYLGMLPSQFLLAAFWSCFPPIATRWKSAATVMQTMMQREAPMPLSMAVVMPEAKAYMVSSSVQVIYPRALSGHVETKNSARIRLLLKKTDPKTLQLSGDLGTFLFFPESSLRIFPGSFLELLGNKGSRTAPWDVGPLDDFQPWRIFINPCSLHVEM